MTENVFGMWKRRLPVLKNMRTDYPNSKLSISCAAILHNWSIMLDDEAVDDGLENHGDHGNGEDEMDENRDDRAAVLQRGQAFRDQLLAAMPRVRPNEQRRGLV